MRGFHLGLNLGLGTASGVALGIATTIFLCSRERSEAWRDRFPRCQRAVFKRTARAGSGAARGDAVSAYGEERVMALCRHQASKHRGWGHGAQQQWERRPGVSAWTE